MEIRDLCHPITKEKIHHLSQLYLNNEEYLKQFDFSLINIRTYRKATNNGLQSYSNGPEGHFSHDPASTENLLLTDILLEHQGNFLDVGSGLFPLPGYMSNTQKYIKWTGIDPIQNNQLHGYEKREYSFYQGYGEFLPFRNKLFDGVLFCSSLDHHIDVNQALMEAHRVLKDHGHLIIMESIRPHNLKLVYYKMKKYIFGYANYNKFHNIAFTKKVSKLI